MLYTFINEIKIDENRAFKMLLLNRSIHIWNLKHLNDVDS